MLIFISRKLERKEGLVREFPSLNILKSRFKRVNLYRRAVLFKEGI